MRAIFTSDESKSRAKFQKMRRYMNIGLFVLCLVIVLVPIQYIIRSTIIFNSLDRSYPELYKDPDFLKQQISSQWYTIAMNLLICILLAITIFLATKSLKRLFAITLKREIW